MASPCPGKTTFIGRLIPGLDYAAIVIWAVLMGTIGYVFGEYWEAVISVIRALGPVAVGVIAFLLVTLYILRRFRRKNRAGK